MLLGLEQLSIDTPTDVQQAVIPLALAGKDVQVCAETGSGKTLAYLLPAMQAMLETPAPDSATRMLILLPTRELAQQVFKVAEHFCSLVQLNVGLLTGGQEFQYQAALLRKNPEIVVATPGRLVDHLKRETCVLSDLEFLILDEADRMLDMGFAEDMDIIRQACGSERQTMLLSATLRHEGVVRIAKTLLREPEAITTRSIQDQHEKIQQQRILADDNAHKDRLLVWLLANEQYDKAIIFANKRDEVQRLVEFVRRHREGVAMLHGEMTQDERKYVMQQLREGKRNILIATDVAARGLDVEGMDLVINYDLARKADEYVHRIGRTGRADNIGRAISLIAPNEWNLKATIERYLQVEMESRKIPGLEGAYKGPKKLKASGKAASTVKRKKKPTGKAAAKAKGASDKKRNGPRPSRPKTAADRGNLMDGEGFAPIRRKKPGES
nr:DEAD/DEAH box helicase [Oceanobacter mangrovi]